MTLDVFRLHVLEDFSKYPAGRFPSHGPNSGERFRSMLVRCLNEYEQVIVDLSGILGYGSSFLEEAFGGLIRVEGFTSLELSKRLSFVGGSISTRERIQRFINDAKPGSS